LASAVDAGFVGWHSTGCPLITALALAAKHDQRVSPALVLHERACAAGRACCVRASAATCMLLLAAHHMLAPMPPLLLCQGFVSHWWLGLTL